MRRKSFLVLLPLSLSALLALPLDPPSILFPLLFSCSLTFKCLNIDSMLKERVRARNCSLTLITYFLTMNTLEHLCPKSPCLVVYKIPVNKTGKTEKKCIYSVYEKGNSFLSESGSFDLARDLCFYPIFFKGQDFLLRSSNNLLIFCKPNKSSFSFFEKKAHGWDACMGEMLIMQAYGPQFRSPGLTLRTNTHKTGHDASPRVNNSTKTSLPGKEKLL